jgi:SH3-like domain-containing protein
MRLFLGTILIFFMWGIASAETISVAVQSASLLSSPSDNRSMVVLQMPEHYPLTILEDTKDFYYVSDFVGRTGWIHKSDVSESKGVVVINRIANLRKGPGTDHEIAFQAEQGVAFKIIGQQEDWLNVAYEDGKTAWIYKTLVWGF